MDGFRLEAAPGMSRVWYVIQDFRGGRDRVWGKVSSPTGSDGVRMEPFFMPAPGAMVFQPEVLEAIAGKVREAAAL